MTGKDIQDAKQSMYSLAHSLGSNSFEQNLLVESLKDVEKYAATDKLCLIGMLGVFYDGLAYGNWPWSIHNSISVKDK